MRTRKIGGRSATQRPRANALRVAVLTLLGVGALWLSTFGSFDQEVRLSVEGGYPLPDFSLPVLNAGLFAGDTTTVRSEDLRGHVALVSFWATWCGPCIAEQPSLLALQDEFRQDGLRLLGVLHQDSRRAALEWLQENNRLQFETLVGTREFARASRGAGLPSTLLVDRSGEITEIFLGYWPAREPYLRDRVIELLNQ